MHLGQASIEESPLKSVAKLASLLLHDYQFEKTRLQSHPHTAHNTVQYHPARNHGSSGLANLPAIDSRNRQDAEVELADFADFAELVELSTSSWFSCA